MFHCGLIAEKGSGTSLCEALLVKLIVLRILLPTEWAGFPRKALTGAQVIARGKTQGTRPSLPSPAASFPSETCFALLDRNNCDVL